MYPYYYHQCHSMALPTSPYLTDKHSAVAIIPLLRDTGAALQDPVRRCYTPSEGFLPHVPLDLGGVCLAAVSHGVVEGDGTNAGVHHHQTPVMSGMNRDQNQLLGEYISLK